MKLWAVTDGAAGNARQAMALAEALADHYRAEVEPVVVVGRYPWRAAAPRSLHGALRHFDPIFTGRVRDELPDVVVGCGRVAALATRLARQASGGRCRAVQVLDPRLAGPYWDVRVVLAHDDHRDAHTVVCTGSLHPINDAWLRDAADAWFSESGVRESPGVAILLGGPTRRARWNVTHVRDWLQRVGGWADSGSGIWVVGSRRTPAAVRAWLRRQDLVPLGRLWLDHGDGPNPYGASLALAKRLVVSPDSVNMLSEAAATRAQLHVAAAGLIKGRLRRFMDALGEVRQLRSLDQGDEMRPVEPWRELPNVAARVVALLGRG